MSISSPLNIFLIEDNRVAAMNFTKTLESYGHRVTYVSSSEAAKRSVSLKNFDLAFIDLDLERERAGFDLIPLFKKHGIFSVVLSGHEEDEYIESGYSFECDDYIVKPYSEEKLKHIFTKFAAKEARLRFRSIIRELFITKNRYILRQINKLEENVANNQSIIITGPTGTGKGVLAKAVHVASNGNEDKYIQINCSAIPDTLIESELFGSTKGAFSGSKDKIGRLVEADGGTLHLDEIGTMSKSLQEKLLVALETNFVVPVGGTQKDKRKTNFRLITSTCENLEDKISKGTFREDLYYRIAGVRIHLTSLAERLEDRKFLVESKIAELKRIRAFVFNEAAVEALVNYNWYGNVRELVTFFKSLESLDTPIVNFHSLPNYIKKNFNKVSERENVFVSPEQLRIIEEISYPEFKKRQEAEVVRHFYEKFDFNKSQTRKALGGMTQYTFDKYMSLIEGEFYEK